MTKNSFVAEVTFKAFPNLVWLIIQFTVQDTTNGCNKDRMIFAAH